MGENAVTLPTHDAQSPKSLTSPSYQASTAHSIPARLTLPATPPLSPRPLSPAEMTSSNTVAHMQGTAPADFSHPWDLATGGFKTLTAKRELFRLSSGGDRWLLTLLPRAATCFCWSSWPVL